MINEYNCFAQEAPVETMQNKVGKLNESLRVANEMALKLNIQLCSADTKEGRPEFPVENMADALNLANLYVEALCSRLEKLIAIIG